MCAVKKILYCFVKFVALVFFFYVFKKTISIKLDPDVSIVYSNNESEVPSRKRPRLGERSFLLSKWAFK